MNNTTTNTATANNDSYFYITEDIHPVVYMLDNPTPADIESFRVYHVWEHPADADMASIVAGDLSKEQAEAKLRELRAQ